MRSLTYVRDAYGVPAKRGMRVTVDGKSGQITCARGHYIRVRFDGDTFSRCCHPTWRVTYHTPEGDVHFGAEDTPAGRGARP